MTQKHPPAPGPRPDPKKPQKMAKKAPSPSLIKDSVSLQARKNPVFGTFLASSFNSVLKKTSNVWAKFRWRLNAARGPPKTPIFRGQPCRSWASIFFGEKRAFFALFARSSFEIGKKGLFLPKKTLKKNRLDVLWAFFDPVRAGFFGHFSGFSGFLAFFWEKTSSKKSGKSGPDFISFVRYSVKYSKIYLLNIFWISTRYKSN